MRDSSSSMIGKSMAVLEALSEHLDGLTLQELTDTLVFPKSSVYKIVTILLELNYLTRDTKSLRYYLSRKLLCVGLKAISSYDIIKESEEFMTHLRDDMGESVMLGALIDDEVVLMKQIQGSLDFVFTLKDGMRFNLYSTAPGKSLFAFVAKEQRNDMLKTMKLTALNDYTITDKVQLKNELDKIKIDGYALDLDETVMGVHCIAAPIFDEHGTAIACVWTSGPSGRMKLHGIDNITQKVKNIGLQISRNIGYKY